MSVFGSCTPSFDAIQIGGATTKSGMKRQRMSHG